MHYTWSILMTEMFVFAAQICLDNRMQDSYIRER